MTTRDKNGLRIQSTELIRVREQFNNKALASITEIEKFYDQVINQNLTKRQSEKSASARFLKALEANQNPPFKGGL